MSGKGDGIQLANLWNKIDDTKERLEAISHKLELHVEKSRHERSQVNSDMADLNRSLMEFKEEFRTDRVSNKEMLEQIYDQIMNSQTQMIQTNAKIDKRIDALHYEVKAIHMQDKIQNDQLEEHIAGVNTLRTLVAEHKKEWKGGIERVEKRVEKVEEPRKVVNAVKGALVWVAGFIAAASAVYASIRGFVGG